MSVKVDPNTIPDEAADAATIAEYEFVYGEDMEPLTRRQLGITRQCMKAAIAAALDEMASVHIERRVTYTYGPNGVGYYKGVFAGEYSWEQLEDMIRDESWGGHYTIIKREERTVIEGAWRAVD